MTSTMQWLTALTLCFVGGCGGHHPSTKEPDTSAQSLSGSRIESIIVSPAEVHARSGEDIRFRATAHRADGSVSDVTSDVSWSAGGAVMLHFDSNEPGLAHFAFADATDEVTYLLAPNGARNELVVSAKLGSDNALLSDTASVVIDDSHLAVESLAIFPTHVDSSASTQVKFEATAVVNGIPVDVTDDVEWTSTNPSVVELPTRGGGAEFVSAGQSKIEVKLTKVIAGVSSAAATVRVD